MRDSIRNLFTNGTLTFEMLRHWKMNKGGAETLIESENTERRLPLIILAAILALSVIIWLLSIGVLNSNDTYLKVIFIILGILFVVALADICNSLRWKNDGFIHRELISDCAVVYDLLNIIGRNCMEDLVEIDGLGINRHDTLNPIAKHSHTDLRIMFNHLLYERTDLIINKMEERFHVLSAFGFTNESWQDYVNNSKSSKSLD